MPKLHQYKDGLSDVVANLSQPIIIVDPNYKVRYCNREAFRFFGKPVSDMLNTNLPALIDPTYRHYLSQHIDELLANTTLRRKRSETLCLTVLKDDGNKVETQATIALIPTDQGEMHVFIVMDVQPSLPLQQAGSVTHFEAVAMGAEFLTALNVLKDPVVIFDDKWRYHFVNQAGWDVLKTKREEVLGRNVWEIRPDLEHTKWKKVALKAMETQERQRVEEFYPASRQWYITSFFPSTQFLICHMENVTALKQTLDINDQLLGSFEEAMNVYWSKQNRGRRQHNKQVAKSPKRKKSA